MFSRFRRPPASLPAPPPPEDDDGEALKSNELAELAALCDGEDSIDADAREQLEQKLFERFTASPEASHGRIDLFACECVMNYADSYFGATIATLDASDLAEIIFQLFPRKVSIEASEASSVIDGLRTFYAFLKREFGLSQADACLEVLAGDATQRLEVALADTSRFGMAKSMLMRGQPARPELETEQEFSMWMRTMARLSAPATRVSPRAPASAATAAAKKRQRKLSRQARRKNR